MGAVGRRGGVPIEVIRRGGEFGAQVRAVQMELHARDADVVRCVRRHCDPAGNGRVVGRGNDGDSGRRGVQRRRLGHQFAGVENARWIDTRIKSAGIQEPDSRGLLWSQSGAAVAENDLMRPAAAGRAVPVQNGQRRLRPPGHAAAFGKSFDATTGVEDVGRGALPAVLAQTHPAERLFSGPGLPGPSRQREQVRVDDYPSVVMKGGSVTDGNIVHAQSPSLQCVAVESRVSARNQEIARNHICAAGLVKAAAIEEPATLERTDEDHVRGRQETSVECVEAGVEAGV